MRIAVVELHVDVSRRRRFAREVADDDAVARALRARPDERNALALRAIEVAGDFEPAIIVCPGWTFVGRAPRAASLSRAAGSAAVLYEVLAYGREGRARRRHRRTGAAETGRTELPWRTDGRRVAGAVVLVCGEVNAVRRQVQTGAPVRHSWDERVRSAGVLEHDLSDALVLNPSHTPAGSYVREKRRAGPWRAIVSTANTLDRSRLGKPALAAPAHAVMAGRDQEPSLEPVAVDIRGSRVVVHDLAIG
jgi:hypothetical protein